MSKPTCKVHGMIQPGAMCSMVIVGGRYCGFTGDCPHKSCTEMIIELVQGAASQATPAKTLTRCAAGRDGECAHAQCPQQRDNEPGATGRHCPLDNEAPDA